MAGVTKVANFDVHVREVDFVSRFNRNWEALREIMGIMRPIRKTPGTQLVSYTASVTLENGAVAEAAEIPFSVANVTEAYKDDVAIEKYAKAVSIEAVNKYGAEVAVQKTDDEFLVQLQLKVLTSFYTFLKTGTLESTATTWQKALAKAKGDVIDKFNKMRKTVTEVVGFVNVNDVYAYLGGAEITVQSSFGLQYIKDFMGYKTLFLLSEPDISEGTVIALPVENIDLYYVDPSDSDFAKLGLDYTVEGETNLIGFHAQGDYRHAVGESYALMGMKLWAEYLDAIAIVTVDANPLNGLTVQSETDEATFPWTDKKASDMQSNITIGKSSINGTLKFIEGGLSPSGPLAGDGYFLALKWSDPAQTVTSLKVGLEPSEGTGLVECISDLDRNGVFKITSKEQSVLLVQSNDDHKTTQRYSLTGLVFESAEETGV